MKKSNLKNWLRGGQIVDHSIKMFRQTFKRILFVSLIFTTLYIATTTWLLTTTNQKKLAFNYQFSTLMILMGIEKGINTIHFNNQKFTLKHTQLIKTPAFITANTAVKNILIKTSYQALILAVLLYFLFSVIVRKQGKLHQSDKFIRGGSLTDNEKFKKSLKRKELSSISFGVIPILKDTETIHFEIAGATGTGKSTTLKQIISDIKKRGDRAIIYSSSTEFVSEFYDQKTDIILNPLDSRSPNWSIWNEVSEVYHYADIAASIIPDSSAASDPFWTDTARSLLSNTARKLKEQGNYDTKILFDKLLSISLKDIAELVKNTAAGTIFADGSEKTALSVRSTLLSKLECFKFLTKDKGSFSIRKWVNNDETKGMVFINSLADQHEVLKPLISTWVDIFASSILSLPEDRDRRIWLIIDELPSLHKLKSLDRILAESRKYGCCVILGYQSYSKIQAIYGDKGAQTLSDSTATKIFYRSNDYQNANHASVQLGKEEAKVTNENLSIGAHAGRDSISISENERERQLILPTEILNLENLQGYYRLPGDYPVVSFTQTFYKSKEKPAIGFIKSTKKDHIYMLEGNNTNESNENEVDQEFIFSDVNIENPPEELENKMLRPL
jgi:type IV conjugative transfer system coupling protein TraD